MVRESSYLATRNADSVSLCYYKSEACGNAAGGCSENENVEKLWEMAEKRGYLGRKVHRFTQLLR